MCVCSRVSVRLFADFAVDASSNARFPMPGLLSVLSYYYMIYYVMWVCYMVSARQSGSLGDGEWVRSCHCVLACLFWCWLKSVWVVRVGCVTRSNR
jgi:hypothetical protein